MPSRTRENPLADMQARVDAANEADAAEPDLEPVDDPNPQALAARAKATDVEPYRDMSEEFGANDVSLPRLKLAQPISKVVVEDQIRAGHWYSGLEVNDLGAEIEFIPLKAFKHRAYFVQGQGLSCRSLDMVYGQGDPGIECAKCELKDWGGANGRTPPPCRENYNFPLLTPDENGDLQPYLLTLTSTSTTAARALLAMAWQRGARTNPMMWPETTYRLKSTRQTNNKGTFYVAQITVVGPTDEGYLEYARMMAGSIQQARPTVVDDED